MMFWLYSNTSKYLLKDYVTKKMVLTCYFHVWNDILFLCVKTCLKLTWYCTGVYIINYVTYHTTQYHTSSCNIQEQAHNQPLNIYSPATTSLSCESRHNTLSIRPILVAACKLGMLFLKIAMSNPRISTY